MRKSVALLEVDKGIRSKLFLMMFSQLFIVIFIYSITRTNQWLKFQRACNNNKEMSSVTFISGLKNLSLWYFFLQQTFFYDFCPKYVRVEKVCTSLLQAPRQSTFYILVLRIFIRLKQISLKRSHVPQQLAKAPSLENSKKKNDKTKYPFGRSFLLFS